MTARVSQLPAQYHVNGVNGINTDPGVYEPECDWTENMDPTGYPDTQEFLNQMAAPAGEPPQPPAEPPVQVEPQLTLAGDYQGMGGPQSVPLYTPSAFEAPPRPVERTILDEIFLEPSHRQLDAYYRVLTKGQV